MNFWETLEYGFARAEEAALTLEDPAMQEITFWHEVNITEWRKQKRTYVSLKASWNQRVITMIQSVTQYEKIDEQK